MKKLTRFCGISLLSLSALWAGQAAAQYTGPSTFPDYKSVAEVLKNPVDDAPVTLEGHLVKQVAKEKYLFRDGSGEIRVEIDKELMPATPVHEKTLVRIRGEVETSFMQSPEIEVDALTLP